MKMTKAPEGRNINSTGFPDSYRETPWNKKGITRFGDIFEATHSKMVTKQKRMVYKTIST